MGAVVYILQSESSGKFYVGSTDDLHLRLSEHHRGQTPSTRGRGPWKLVYQERFASLLEARRRELEIKRWKSAKMIHGLIRVGAGLKEHHFRRFGRLQAMRFFGCGHTRALL
jgi:putative endonuclease